MINNDQIQFLNTHIFEFFVNFFVEYECLIKLKIARPRDARSHLRMDLTVSC